MSVARGTDIPVTNDPDKVFVTEDKPAQGGDKTVGIPEYTLVIKNFPGTAEIDILLSDDGGPLRDDAPNEIIL